MERLLTMRFCLKREMLTTVRLATGGLSSFAGLGIDGAEDLKVCVTEGLLLLSRRGYREAEVSFSGGIPLKVELIGLNPSGEGEEKEEEEEISVALLQALVEGLRTETNGGKLEKITFLFGAE